MVIDMVRGRYKLTNLSAYQRTERLTKRKFKTLSSNCSECSWYYLVAW